MKRLNVSYWIGSGCQLPDDRISDDFLFELFNCSVDCTLGNVYIVSEEDVILLKLQFPEFDKHITVEDYEATSV